MELQILESSGLRSGHSILNVSMGSCTRPLRAETGNCLKFEAGSRGKVSISAYYHFGTANIAEAKPSILMPIVKMDGQAATVELKTSELRQLVANGSSGAQQDAIQSKNEYLSKHGISDTVQKLIADVLKTKPADPTAFLLDRLRRLKAKEGGAADPDSPKTPKEHDQEVCAMIASAIVGATKMDEKESCNISAVVQEELKRQFSE